jgi:hypothetical protein
MTTQTTLGDLIADLFDKYIAEFDGDEDAANKAVAAEIKRLTETGRLHPGSKPDEQDAA